MFRIAITFVNHLLQRVRVIVHQTQPAAKTLPHAATPVPVLDPALQDTVKQRPPLVFRPTGILFHQFKHGVLDDIQSIVGIAGGDACQTKGPPLDTGKKPVQGQSFFQNMLPGIMDLLTVIVAQTIRPVMVLNRPDYICP